MTHTAFPTTVVKGALTGLVAVAMFAPLATTANAAEATGDAASNEQSFIQYDVAQNPAGDQGKALTTMLGDFNTYWTPNKGVASDAGEKVLAHDDALTEEINNKAAADTKAGTNDQQARAYSDAQMDTTDTLYEAFGPTIGAYFKADMNAGKLPKTTAYLKSMGVSTSNAKSTYAHPRPYIDRANYKGQELDLKGLKDTLNIQKVQAYENQGEYASLADSGSFPSGHTTFAFSKGTALAAVMPELGAQIMTRVSEAGNNRIVLGVHYPLDIMGGHIAGAYGVATALSDPATAQEAKAVRAELQSVLGADCKADGLTKDVNLHDCINATNANGQSSKKQYGGYTNSFTDDVVTKPVTDEDSTLAAYTARMTYGFEQTGDTTKRPVVPEGAENLLANVDYFNTDDPANGKLKLSTDELRQVIAASEIKSGYPLDADSNGWGRINLAAIYTARVTFDKADAATRKITGISFGHHRDEVEIEAAKPSVPTQPKADAITNLLTDYNTYFDFYNANGVKNTDVAKATTKHDDDLTASINNKAFGADGKTAQDQRALSDAQMNSTNTLYDALGPVLGQYYKTAMDNGKLPQTKAFLATMDKSASTGTAKAYYQHPRPYIDRVNFQGKTLNIDDTLQNRIKKVPGYETFDWGDGETPDNEYTSLYNSGSFPSGHTTFAFTQGAGLAYILPELGPEIMTRVSEAGNNRIVLGVHYPLDILGGHIAGQYGVATAVSSDAKAKAEAAAARTELVNYLTAQCKADKHGDTLESCIDNTKANSTDGYKNDFTDDVVKNAVTDRKSAIAAYKARMTYGFQTTGKTDQAAVVPDAAVSMLDNVAAFKNLTTDQKKAVLAATEGDSGYPLDASSKGWARINLAAAYSAKVTLSSDKKTVEKVEPGQAEASVVVATPDTTAPVFSGVQDATVALNSKFDALAGVTAKDDKDGDVTADIKVSGSVNTAKAGEYTLTYTVSDKAGNTATAKRVITVAAKGTAPAGNTNGVKTAGQLGKTGVAITGIALVVIVAAAAGVTMVIRRRRA
ncbi:phosphatase PAP2 family protein [Bifidobacterium sp. 82T24]|uniref:phosphatase PAP2 family protein n=1 Tax=Bifidobacterium pluvialisilvae TaxID=2834436 RepID=UPI001C57B0CF|nr:phosphatase PAP2 family protein [Bifidobacterium pluvialisilvae]MBW3088732.1 phosphatase PAP2 family protein [Bifidobacterium pluvialisilvae]